MGIGKRRDIYVGVDVGGTKILAGVVDERGKVYARRRLATPRNEDSGESVAVIISAIEQVLKKASVKRGRLCGIAVAVPGQIAPEEGLVVNTPNMNLSGVELSAKIENAFGVACALENDVRLGTLGEAWLGAARGAETAMGIFIGTGIGGGLIMHGILERGRSGIAGEIGHTLMAPDGPRCGCGARGCFEALAGRSAIERDIWEAVSAGRESLVGDLVGQAKGLLRGKVLKDALRQKDAVVTEVMTRAARVVGAACVNVRHVLDPEVIVLGGGVMEACGWFVMPIVRQVISEDPLPGVEEEGEREGEREGEGEGGAQVVEAILGDDAVILGAVALARGFGREVPVEAGEVPLPKYPKIDYIGPGEAAIASKLYSQDVYVRGDGKVRRRRVDIAREAFGTVHKIGIAELERVCKGRPEHLVICMGRSGRLMLEKEGAEFLRERRVSWELLRAADAVKAFNRLKGRKAAIIHVAC